LDATSSLERPVRDLGARLRSRIMKQCLGVGVAMVTAMLGRVLIDATTVNFFPVWPRLSAGP
jgi:hypothetical protein